LDENKIQRWEVKKLLRFILFSASLSLCQNGPRPRQLVFMIKASVKRKDEYGALWDWTGQLTPAMLGGKPVTVALLAIKNPIWSSL
jgi:hypothetical protein